ncbi:family S53 protease [Artomyces pyxidatus]|uniref:Family S53 protease n=1 Tax=Artomyces pyxidatus TaxID=48021 RepID=A0ACB8T0I1_9AGAM|nr:family S53 protease [Artomyces pyxidatus]
MVAICMCLSLVSLFSLAYASSHASHGMVVRERHDRVPNGFVHSGVAPSDVVLNLRIGLAQGNFPGLEEALYAVSTPGSELYGHHLSKEEAEAFVEPTAETSTSIKSWLASHGLSATAATPAGDWLKLSLTVEQANELLDANFSTFTHKNTGRQTIRTLSYSVPAELTTHITFVHPTVLFPMKPFGTGLNFKSLGKAKRDSDAASASCENEFTPACIQELYGIPTKRATQESNHLAVTGSLGNFANKADLKFFLTQFRKDLPVSTTFSLQTLDGGSNSQKRSEAGSEADLDTQYTIGIASGVPVTFISVGNDDNDGIGGFLDIIEFLLNETSVPHVLSTSYGFDENYLTTDIVTPVCNAYAQLGARGTSLLFASGDGGVSGGQFTSDCTTFIPTFPSTCPFVTSVGGTAGLHPETAANFSAGGFSTLFPMPSYQAEAVNWFLSGLGSTFSGLFNASGRAYPDLSAVGVNVPIVWEGKVGTVDGTSCSTPITAGMIALLNDELIAAKKSPLGFLNPFIYQNSDIFTDITAGTNPGCGTNGFIAGKGWDPVTGVGSPVFAKLRTAVGL